jgi:hypothetical protein
MEVQLHSFLTSAVDGGACLAPLPGLTIPKERRRAADSTGGWMGATAGLDVSENRNICCPSRHSNPVSSSPQPIHCADLAKGPVSTSEWLDN